MKHRHIITAALALFCLSVPAVLWSEQFREEPTVSEEALPREELEFLVIDEGQYGIANVGLQAWSTGNSALWQTWRLMYGHRTPQSVFEIDLSSYTVIILGLGTRPTGGYSIEVTSVYLNDETLMVEFAEHVPPADAMVTQALTYPYLLGVVRGQHHDVEFLKVSP